MIVIGFLCLVALFVYEKFMTLKEPLIPIHLFRNRGCEYNESCLPVLRHRQLMRLNCRGCVSAELVTGRQCLLFPSDYLARDGCQCLRRGPNDMGWLGIVPSWARYHDW